MLQGIRVLDFTHTLSGLYCGMLLIDLGAEVIQIEPTQKGAKGVGSRIPSGYHVDGFDMRFLHLCRGKKSILLNLKDEAAKSVFHDLVRKSDVVLDNLRPAAADRLGIGYEVLKEVNHKIISCSISGYNRSGRFRDLPGFDYVAQAASGYWSMTGEPGRPPVVSSIPLIDAATGMFAAHGILAALYQRTTSAIGQKVDLSLLGTAMAFTLYDGTTYLNSGRVPGPQGTKIRSIPLFGAFKTKDSYIALCIITEQQFESLCSALDAGHLLKDPRFDTRERRVENRERLDDLFEEMFSRWDTASLLNVLSAADIPSEEIVGLDKAFSNPRVLEENLIDSLEWKGRSFHVLKTPIRMSEGRVRKYNAPPDPGAHTEEIASQILGYSEEKIAGLKEKGVIA
jgi:crotonobetainyl-CoA:carnitine CoA-transferase CaiB-like acyl-CoA transferase